MSIVHVLCVKQWPILSLGDGLGNREILFEGSSDCTGAFVVEEIIDEDGSLLRRLVFLSTPHMAQSEAKVMQGTHTHAHTHMHTHKTRTCTYIYIYIYI